MNLAAAKEHTLAMYHLAILYLDYNIKREARLQKLGMEWLEKAVDCGAMKAQKDLDELRALMANEKSAMEELESYIGLNKVKQKMHEFETAIRMRERRLQLGQNFEDNGFMHMVFIGNAGTGKTEVAKLVARILCEIGVITKPEPVIAERADLVAGVIGKTAEKTDEVIKKALGGVLFIDEAYTLAKPGGI